MGLLPAAPQEAFSYKLHNPTGSDTGYANGKSAAAPSLANQRAPKAGKKKLPRSGVCNAYTPCCGTAGRWFSLEFEYP
jgi:hypothetical protein